MFQEGLSVYSKLRYSTFMENPSKQIGVGIIFLKEEQILLLFRSNTKKNSNLYGLIGGLVEKGESPQTAAQREALEEIGVEIPKNALELSHCMSSIENGVETVGLYFVVRHWNGIPESKETNKHDHLAWFSLKNLPENIIPRNKQAIQMVTKGVPYSEYGWDSK